MGLLEVKVACAAKLQPWPSAEGGPTGRACLALPGQARPRAVSKSTRNQQQLISNPTSSPHHHINTNNDPPNRPYCPSSRPPSCRSGRAHALCVLEQPPATPVPTACWKLFAGECHEVSWSAKFQHIPIDNCSRYPSLPLLPSSLVIRWAMTLGIWGAAAGGAVALFMQKVPIFQRDVLDKVPFVGAFFKGE